MSYESDRRYVEDHLTQIRSFYKHYVTSRFQVYFVVAAINLYGDGASTKDLVDIGFQGVPTLNTLDQKYHLLNALVSAPNLMFFVRLANAIDPRVIPREVIPSIDVVEAALRVCNTDIRNSTLE